MRVFLRVQFRGTGLMVSERAAITMQMRCVRTVQYIVCVTLVEVNEGRATVTEEGSLGGNA